MTPLRNRINLGIKNNGNIVNFYKENSLKMNDLYRKSNEMCKSVTIRDIYSGGFYFFHYMDQSNWMRFSPVFCIEYKKMNNLTVILGVNFNFIPLEIRSALFEKFISEEDFDENRLIKVNFEGVYKQLIRYGMEYSIVEYNISQIKLIHRISLELIPEFLYSSHPKNKYDPNKLVQIWTSKIESREKRHQEIIASTLDEFYKVESLTNDKFDALKGHIERLQRSFQKYGDG